ncbi:hypothetical protein WA158_003413 [Blastocystis sp. Blastoise]
MNYLVVALLCLACVVSADKWVVLVSGNDNFSNYCITSTICRGYALATRNGIPRDHIVYLSPIDNFYGPMNIYPGKMFTKNSTDGLPEDYGAECYEYIDYNEETITPALFMNVLSGNAEAITKATGIEKPKVVQSNEEDTIFVYYMDHGSPGLCQVVDGLLTEDVLMKTIQQMHDNKKYNKLVFYFEACYSGSMFTNLPKGLNVYAFTGADDRHSSWMSFCPPYDKVNNVTMHTCLSAYYDDEWEDYVEEKGTKISHNDLWKLSHDHIALKTDQNVSQFGDIDTVGKDLLSEYFGEKAENFRSPMFNRIYTINKTMLIFYNSYYFIKPVDHINIADVPVHLAKWNLIRSDKQSNNRNQFEDQLKEAVEKDIRREIYVSRLVSKALDEQQVEKAMKFKNNANSQCVYHLTKEFVRQCKYELPFREEHVNALHYLCSQLSIEEIDKHMNFVC